MDEDGPGRVEPGQEDVIASTGVRELQRIRGDRHVGRPGRPDDGGAAGVVHDDVEGGVLAADVGGVGEGGRGVELGHVDVEGADQCLAEASWRGGEVRGAGESGVGAPALVHGHTLSVVGGATTQVGGVGEGRAGEVERGDERVRTMLVHGLEGTRRGRAVGGDGFTAHVGVPGLVHGNALGSSALLPPR